MKKNLAAAISLLAVLCVALYFRCYPIFLPQLWNSAERFVAQQINQSAFEDINKRFAGLDDMSKARLFEQSVAEYKKQKKSEIKRRVRAEYDKIKDRFQDKNGHTYLMELDGWHWARYVENIDRLGHVGDEVRYGKQHDNLMLFPKGDDLLWNNFFYYSSWTLYKVFSFFQPIELFNFLFYLPLFFMAVFMVLLYLFSYRSLGNLAAVICCVFVGCGPIFIPRSCAGWFDYDVLTLIFPLLIVWTYLLANNGSSLRKRAAWSVFSAFWLGLFCQTWLGWSFILFIILFYEFIALADYVSERLQYGRDTSTQIKNHLFVLAVFILSGVFWIFLLCGAGPFQGLAAVIKEAVSLNNPLTSSIWPNVFSTLGELKSGDYLTIAKSVGGVFMLALILVAMLGVFLNIKKYGGMKRELLLVLVVWFMTIFFLCSKGIRFAIFLLVPLGIFLGWGIDEIYRFISSREKWKLALIPLVLSVAALIASMLGNADVTAKGALPLMEDQWYSALTTIKNHTPADSVINSWWDFGDWFKSVAHRAVIFDGQSQDTPRAYWMARALLTDSEKEAVGILRMLNNEGNEAFDIVNKLIPDPFMSVFLIKNAILLGPGQGKEMLSKYLPPGTADEVGRLLYSRPRQNAYFIVDSSMIGKLTAISYIGNWDFAKKYLSRAIRVKPEESIMRELAGFGLDRATAERYYQEASFMSGHDFDSWVSRRMGINGMAYQKKSQDGLVLFNNGYFYNPDKKTIYSYSSFEEKYRIPRSLFLVEGDKIEEEPLAGNDSIQSAMVSRSGEVYRLVMLNPELAGSMFVRLQLLKGAGLEHFKLFTREGAEDNNSILVYEVKWD